MYPGTHAQKTPDKAAIIQASTGLTLTYRELDEQSNQLAQLLCREGLRPDDHLALFMENHPRFLIIVWACLRAGLFVTPINRHLSAAEAAYIVDDCDARVLVASAALEQSEELGRLVTRCELKLATGGACAGFSDYDEAVGSMPTGPIADEQVGTLMLYSSGTTGKPKGVKRTRPPGHARDGNPLLVFLASLFDFDADSIYLTPAPMYHAAPLGYSNATLTVGGTVVMMDKFEPEPSLEFIERYRVTHSQWVPTMFIRMLKLPEDVRNRYDLSSHRHAIHAAAPCPVEVKRRMIDWWGPVIDEYYSSTEAAGFTRISSEEWLAHPGSVGRPMGRAFHICDDSGAELPPGETGLIYAEMAGAHEVTYHKDAEKSASARHPRHDDWLCVGDIGYLDEDGYLYLADRKSFMIISGGVNIYPQQIEDVLALYPGIEDVAVIGVPNEDLGEEARALVQLSPGVAPGEQLTGEIMGFVREKLGKQLVPRSLEYVDSLPRTPAGKLNKKSLRDRYWPGANKS